jgi:hypothetical protein
MFTFARNTHSCEEGSARRGPRIRCWLERASRLLACGEKLFEEERGAGAAAHPIDPVSLPDQADESVDVPTVHPRSPWGGWASADAKAAVCSERKEVHAERPCCGATLLSGEAVPDRTTATFSETGDIAVAQRCAKLLELSVSDRTGCGLFKTANELTGRLQPQGFVWMDLVVVLELSG